jgi:hypothetical protein
MSTRIDILQAKDDLTGHQAAHRCSTGGGCPERIALWQVYMATAGRWGIEPGDPARVAAQYAALPERDRALSASDHARNDAARR